MPRMVCMKCQLFFHPKKNGVVIEEGMPSSSFPNAVWSPYKLWRADLWECLGCNTEVVAGFGAGPFAEHYQSNYAEMKEAFSPPIAFVKDCL